MKKETRPLDPRRQRTIEVIATFATMMHAYERGELSMAADAQAELERLGVSVRYVRPRAEKGGTDDQ